jgi:type II secretory pathway component GspD/PulD (secretin)
MRSPRSSALSAAFATMAVVSLAARQAPPPAPVVSTQAGAALQAPQTSTSQRPALPATQPVTALEESSTTRLDGPFSVSLAVADPLPIRDALVLLVHGTPFSIVVEDSVQGTFAGELKNVTMRQALESVLFPRGLDYAVDGNLIRVFPRRPATRLFEVDLVNARRAMQWTNTRADSDVYEELSQGVGALLSPEGRVHVDKRAGLVQVTDYVERLDRVGVYLDSLQLRATRQVRLNARVFELTFADRASSGIDWRALESAGVHGAATASGFRVDDEVALMRALGLQGTVKQIAAPPIVAMNNEPALLRVGTQQVYFTTSRQTADGRTDRVSTPSTVLEGFSLALVPQIAADGIVQVTLSPAFSEKTGEAKSPGGDIVPIMRVAETDSTIRVRSGDTVAIGGFFREHESAKPGTGIGGFFGTQTKEQVRSELVILITATVVTPSATTAGAR